VKARRALVRAPGNAYTRCISCHPLRHTISLSRARAQHQAYRITLSELGLDIIEMEQDNELPDACFVEDTAVVHSGKALICRLAKESRRGEEMPVERLLRQYLKTKRAELPATIEGGDVIHLPEGMISGVTQRTNKEGVRQMSAWLGTEVTTVEDRSITHLKSYATFLGKGTMLATQQYATHPALAKFDVLVVPNDETYAANSLTIDGTVLLPAGRPKTTSLVRSAGYDVVNLDTSEFEKCEGALTCLSLLF